MLPRTLLPAAILLTCALPCRADFDAAGANPTVKPAGTCAGQAVFASVAGKPHSDKAAFVLARQMLFAIDLDTVPIAVFAIPAPPPPRATATPPFIKSPSNVPRSRH